MPFKHEVLEKIYQHKTQSEIVVISVVSGVPR